MKILNFIPLLIWGLGFFFWSSWDQHLRRIDNAEYDKEEIEAVAKCVLVGIIFWLFIGVFLSV